MRLSVLGLALLAFCGTARAADAPLFVDFQRFCVATGVRPNAIAQALAAAGATARAPSADGLVEWEHTVDGQTLTISYGTTHEAASDGRPEADSEHCMIASSRDSDPGGLDVFRWAAMKPAISRQGPILSFFFEYREVGGVRTLAADDADFARGMADGTAWQLLIDSAPGGALVFLNHFPAPKGAAK